jgi:hypothetical protein
MSISQVAEIFELSEIGDYEEREEYLQNLEENLCKDFTRKCKFRDSYIEAGEFLADMGNFD